MRGNGDQGERVRIDLIEVDPEVFVDDAGRSTRRPRSALRAVGLVSVISVAAVAWWPRSEPPEWNVFHPAVVPAAGMTDELVFDQPPGELSGTDLAPAPVDVRPALGYVFGEPGGTFLGRRWASFRTRWNGRGDAPAATEGPIVGGVSAEVRRLRVRRFVEWGPLDGLDWTVTTNRFKEAETIDFANHVAIIDELPALANGYDLGGMVPVGSIAALDCVVMLTSLFDGDRLLGPVMPTLVRWESPLYNSALGSIAAPSDALPLVEFVLGEGRAVTVHGQPAVAITSSRFGPVIAWLDDGRLIMVQQDVSDEELITLAESVRPASEDEWRQVQLSSIRDDGELFIDFGDAVRLYQGVDAVTGDNIAVSVQAVEGQLVACVERLNSSSGAARTCELGSLELPLLMTLLGADRGFVLAMVDPVSATGAALRVGVADGFLMIPLQDFGPEVPGLVAVAQLPENHGTIELWNAGEVVATI